MEESTLKINNIDFLALIQNSKFKISNFILLGALSAKTRKRTVFANQFPAQMQGN